MNDHQRAEAVAEQLVTGHDAGESVASLARRYDLRREAVTGVLVKAGRTRPSTVQARILAFVRDNPGLSVDDIALRLDMSKSSISRYLRDTDEAKLVVSRKRVDRTQFTDQEMAEALRSVWRQLPNKAAGLSRVRYNKLRTEEMPAASTYIRRYSSWSAACEKAGIAASKPRRNNYTLEWTDTDILEAVNEFVETTNERAYHPYATWARQHNKPSGPLVIMRFSTWADARRAALKHGAPEVPESESTAVA